VSAPRYAAIALFIVPYAAASLFHHLHNAEFIADYPNIPGWMTPAAVYAAWLATTLVGVAGCILLLKGKQLAGLALVALYGAAGLYSLAHYALAPAAAHSLAINLGIWLEVVTGLVLLSTATFLARRAGR
jgi:hypothetical protein